MTKQEVKALRDAWEKLGNPDCEHSDLRLARSEHRYLTGNYICTRCGAEIYKKPS